MIREAIADQKGISLIRVGDVMAKLLSRKEVSSLQNVSRFLGIPYPKEFYRELEDCVMKATIVGVSHFEKSIIMIHKFMSERSWDPQLIADSFMISFTMRDTFTNLLENIVLL